MADHKSKMGNRNDLPHFVRSSWEANIARYYRYMGQEYGYEKDIFYFIGVKNGAVNYKPDFKLSENHYVEVKGNMTSRDRTKLKRMAKFHPHVRVEVLGKKEYQEIEKQYGHLIPNWEFPPKKPKNAPKKVALQVIPQVMKAYEELAKTDYEPVLCNPEESVIDIIAHGQGKVRFINVVYLDEGDTAWKTDRVEDFIESYDYPNREVWVYQYGKKGYTAHKI